MTGVEQELRDRWAIDAGTARGAEAALTALLSRYREPHRRYHGLAHLLRALRKADELLAATPVADAPSVRLALWFHDAVYRPGTPGDEAASARLAERVLGELGLPARRVQRVARLVEATAGHEPTMPDEAVVCDADLAVLAADPATYDAYVTGVRAEYAALDDVAWRSGRAAFLRGLLARPQLFHTDAMRGVEATARANLVAELAGLAAVTSMPVSDAPETVTEAVRLLEVEGYTGELHVGSAGVDCPACRSQHRFDELVADRVFRFEGMSNPDDEAIVIGLSCPACGAKGILVSAYGPGAEPEQLTGIRMIAARYAG